MKKLLLVLSLFLAFGCTMSIEKRCEALAKSEIQKLIGTKADYEVLETKVDSAYTSIYTNPDVAKAAYELMELNAGAKRKMLQYDYNDAKSSMAIWSGSDSAFSREQYRQAKEKFDDCVAKMKELDAEESSAIEKIRTSANNVEEGHFCGYNIYHRFRSGSEVVTVLIIADENIENVIGRFIIDDNVDYSLQNLKKVIDKAIGR